MFSRERKNVVIGVDIGTSSIRAVAIERNNELLTLQNYNELYLGKYVGKEVGEYVNLSFSQLEIALSDSIRELKTDAGQVVLGIPSTMYIFKRVILPSYVVKSIKDSSALHNVVALEFKKVVPGVEILNYGISFTTVQEDENYIQYLVMAIKEDYANMLRNFISKTNKSFSIEPSIFGGIRTIPFETIQDNAVLINMEENNIDLVFLNSGKMVGVETINTGMNKIVFNIKNSLLIHYSEARKILLDFDYKNTDNDNISDIIKLSTINSINDMINIFNNYEISYNIKYNKIYIGGSFASIKNINLFYEKNFNREIKIIDPFSRVFVPTVLEEMIKQNSNVFMNSLGLAINNV
ncbi:MAG: type pilus assembly protein PilM [Patescibacteria group bacterium]|nr:type pilus assembly protein PilM [Patescibacteria group bacterium]